MAKLGAMWNDTKYHSHEAAFEACVRDLIKRGYTRVDSRSYRPPDGGPIVMLTKRSRFGAPVYTGKTSEGAKYRRGRPIVRARHAVRDGKPNKGGL